MTGLDLFHAIGGDLPAVIEAEYGRHDNCILATRVAIEVAQYFRIDAHPLSVRVVLLNAQFARHVEEEGDADVAKWKDVDGSHSVGIGFGFAPGQPRDYRWDGHLIVTAAGCFADFAIQQAERTEKGIITGPALIGPLPEGARSWSAVQRESGTVIHYLRTDDMQYRRAPDWKDPARRRKLSAPIIRTLKAATR
jgi:hypothetical protein